MPSWCSMPPRPDRTWISASSCPSNSPRTRRRGAKAQPGAFLVTKGWLRASHQDGHTSATTLTPGQIYKVEVPLQPIAYRFRQGNRIRVEVVNGDSPVTDALFFHIYRPDKMGTDTIHHDAAHPSHLVLPVMPKS